MQNHLQELLQKEMTRKEFLGVFGFGIASLLGFERIIKLVTTTKPAQTPHAMNGYGGSDFGK